MKAVFDRTFEEFEGKVSVSLALMLPGVF